MEFKLRPTYDAVLPSVVRFDDQLTPLDKLIYAEIFAWCRMSGKDCYAGDNFFGDMFSVQSHEVFQSLERLDCAGYIKLGWISVDGIRRIALSDVVMFDE